MKSLFTRIAEGGEGAATCDGAALEQITVVEFIDWCNIDPFASALLSNLDESMTRSAVFAARKLEEQKLLLEQLANIEAALEGSGGLTESRELMQVRLRSLFISCTAGIFILSCGR